MHLAIGSESTEQVRAELAGKRIAIVRLSAIGDVIHVLPLVSSIRAAVPGAHVTWFIQPTPWELVQHHSGVDEFVLFERRPLLRSLERLRREMRGREFYVLLAPHTSLKAGLVTALLRSPRKIGFDRARAPELNWLFTTERIPARPRGHMQDEVLEFVDYLEIPRRLEWGIEPTDDERERYSALLPPSDRPTVALATASTLASKDWPAERFAELADRLEGELGARSILVGGRSGAELAAVATIQRLARSRPPDLGAWDLRRLTYLIDRADVLVSPDTGPLHIGVALGTPSVALIGYTNPKRVGPYRFRELMVDAFGDPGEAYEATAGYREGRMERIGVGQVVAKVREALEGLR
ncbi:MAG: glycosyl transferase [Gemmatimonas sp.]|nr:glycosyl transferase [Gemmatimonas sp.]